MYSAQLIAQLKDWHLLNHPFYQAWMQGTLTLQQLQNYAIQYYPHVEAFPRYVSAAHSLCEDASARADLARNLADEEGILHGSPHPELWLNFAEGLGLAKQQVLQAKITPAAQTLKEGFLKLSQSSYPEALASLFSYEYQVPAIATSKIEGLQRNYNINSKKALEFFQVHEAADIYHSEACSAALDKLTVLEQKKASQAAQHSSRLLWDFLSEAYAAA